MDDDGLPRCLAVGDVAGQVLLALPASAWHRKVAKRTAPIGFLVVCLPQRSLRAHCPIGPCLFPIVSDDAPTVSFGEMADGELLAPTVEALVALFQAQVAATPQIFHYSLFNLNINFKDCYSLIKKEF